MKKTGLIGGGVKIEFTSGEKWFMLRFFLYALMFIISGTTRDWRLYVYGVVAYLAGISFWAQEISNGK